MDCKTAVKLLVDTLAALEVAGLKIAVLKDGKALPLSGKIGFGCRARPSLLAQATCRFCEDCPGDEKREHWDCLVEHLFIGVK
jgi:hypothetical protein